MILLNPGPVNVSARVRNALMGPDICHRESECAELIGTIRRKLLEAFVPGAESDYTAILLTGSGTAGPLLPAGPVAPCITFVST